MSRKKRRKIVEPATQEMIDKIFEEDAELIDALKNL